MIRMLPLAGIDSYAFIAIIVVFVVYVIHLNQRSCSKRTGIGSNVHCAVEYPRVAGKISSQTTPSGKLKRPFFGTEGRSTLLCVLFQWYSNRDASIYRHGQ